MKVPWWIYSSKLMNLFELYLWVDCLLLSKWNDKNDIIKYQSLTSTFNSLKLTKSSDVFISFTLQIKLAKILIIELRSLQFHMNFWYYIRYLVTMLNKCNCSQDLMNISSSLTLYSNPILLILTIKMQSHTRVCSHTSTLFHEISIPLPIIQWQKQIISFIHSIAAYWWYQNIIYWVLTEIEEHF